MIEEWALKEAPPRCCENTELMTDYFPEFYEKDGRECMAIPVQCESCGKMFFECYEIKFLGYAKEV